MRVSALAFALCASLFSASLVMAAPRYDHDHDRDREEQHWHHHRPSASASMKPRRAIPVQYPVLALGTPNDLARCPSKSVACPTMPMFVADVTPSTEWECVAVQEDLYSCGGCATLYNDELDVNGLPTTSGTDCSSVPGVGAATCQAGKCVAYSCMPGHKLVNGQCVAV